ncbi:MAG: SigE family RNA polymerase sigma factor [Nakamurella sp.]
MTPPGLDFDAFVADHGRELERYAYVLTGQPAAAQDLVQTALLKAYRRWRRIAQVDHPHAYVRRILTNAYLDLRRRPVEQPMADVPEPVPDGTVIDPVDKFIATDEIRRALTVLSPHQRAVIVLRHFGGLDDAAIAVELGCGQGTVRTHATRGLQRMRAALDGSTPTIELDGRRP